MNSMMIIVILVPMILGKLPDWFPFKPEEGGKFPPVEELDRRYRKWYWLGNIVVLPTMVISVALVNYLLSWFMSVYQSGFSDAVVLFAVDSSLLLLSSLFLGIFLAALAMLYVSFLIFRRHFWEYMYYENHRAGYNVTRLSKLMSFTVAPLALVLYLLALDTYTAFYQDRIEVNEFFSLSKKTYRYSDIQETALRADNSGSGGRSGYRILFKDGYQWDSLSSPYNYPALKQDKLKRLLNVES